MVLTRSLSRASQNSGGSISAQFSPPTNKIGCLNAENSVGLKNDECSANDLLMADTISLTSSIDAEQFLDQSGSEQIDDIPVVLPESDPTFHRRLFIMQSGFKSGEIYSLPHPRTGHPCLYMLNERAEPSELMQLGLEDQRPRSMFCGDTVVAEPGPILMFLPVHPLFLVLRHFEANAKDQFLTIREFLHHEPTLQLLATNEKLLKTLKIAADFEDDESDLPPKFRYNRDKMMDWLKTKFFALKVSLKASIMEGINDGEDCNNSIQLEKNALDILADYLPQSFADQLQDILGIIEATKIETDLPKTPKTGGIYQNNKINESNRKRAANNPLGSFNSPKAIPAAKKRMAKILAEASKGTKSLHSFFTGNKKEDEKKEEENSGN